jgi:hypothetical protein
LFIHFSIVETENVETDDFTKSISLLNHQESAQYFNSLTFKETQLSANQQRIYLITYFQRQTDDPFTKIAVDSLRSCLSDKLSYLLTLNCEVPDERYENSYLCFNYEKLSSF